MLLGEDLEPQIPGMCIVSAFGNGDPNSTSGFLVPGYYVFAKNNISASDFKRTVNAGMKPTRWPSPTSRWMLPPTTPKTSTS